MRTLPSLFLTLAACLSATPGWAQFSVGAGAQVNFGDAHVDLGCGDLVVAGQASASGVLSDLRDFSLLGGGVFAQSGGQLSVGRNFADGGTFTAGTGSVDIVDACGGGVSQLSGATTFYGLAVTTTLGKQLILPVGLTQTVTNALTLTGAPGNLLQVQSTTPHQRANLSVSAAASQHVDYVSARDNAATAAHVAPGPAASYHSVDAGNLLNWFSANGTGPGSGVTPTPALSLSALFVLILMLMAASFVLRWRQR